MAARLGNVLYWFCSIISALLVLLAGFILLYPGEDAMVWVPRYAIAAVVIWALGRAARYIFSNG